MFQEGFNTLYCSRLFKLKTLSGSTEWSWRQPTCPHYVTIFSLYYITVETNTWYHHCLQRYRVITDHNRVLFVVCAFWVYLGCICWCLCVCVFVRALVYYQQQRQNAVLELSWATLTPTAAGKAGVICLSVFLSGRPSINTDFFFFCIFTIASHLFWIQSRSLAGVELTSQWVRRGFWSDNVECDPVMFSILVVLRKTYYHKLTRNTGSITPQA